MTTNNCIIAKLAKLMFNCYKKLVYKDLNVETCIDTTPLCHLGRLLCA